MQKEIIILPNKKQLEFYEKYNINTFLLPMKDFSIGFNTYFTKEEINKLSDKYCIYVLINKFMHKNIDKFKNIYDKFNKNIKFIVEDIGLSKIIDKDRIVIYENHIISNYKAINYLDSLGYNSIVINNDLTIHELKEIQENTSSNLYYFYISKNMLMYSRRNLVSNYNDYYNNKSDSLEYVLREKVSNKLLEIKEEDDGSIVRYNKIFCASKYLKDLGKLNLIIDLTNINEVSEMMILENINNENLYNLIDSDYYFLENDIKYKVGDIK